MTKLTTMERLLRTRKKVVFRRPKKLLGQCVYGANGRIFVGIKPRRLSPARIYLHELIHHVYPKLSENQVQYMEKYLWKRLTNYEVYLLYRKLFLHPYTSNEKE